jgi:catechol 2,3-dioxygenase-like lactoylglutathione lyase family enzyme
MFDGVNHLAMVTRDMNRTIRFWRDLLGMRMVAGLGKRGYKLYFFETSPRHYVVFFEWPDVQPVEEKDHGYPA